MLRLHDEELVIANHCLKELQCDGGVLVLAYATREELHTHTHTDLTFLNVLGKQPLMCIKF